MKAKLIVLISSVLFISSCMKNKGTITQTYNKATAKYANIDAIRAEPLIEPARPITQTGKVYFGDKILLIGEKNEGIHVFNNTNTRSPIKSIFINLPFCDEFYVEGNFLYAETHYDLVKIDISVLTNPVLVARNEFAFGDAITNGNNEVLIGFDYQVVTETFELNSPEEKELRNSNALYFDYNDHLIPESSVPTSFAGSSGKAKGTLNKIAVSNSHVYVVGSSHLYTFSDNGNSLNRVKKESIGFEIETVYEEDQNLFIGTRSSMIVMDISNPSSPTTTSQYDHLTACDPVYPNGDVAYLTLRTAEFEGCAGSTNLLEVIDITDLNNPQKVNEVIMQSPYGMALVGNHLFVGEGSNGISILDASTANNPNEVYHNSGIQTYDVLEHPNMPNVILVIDNGGLKQYQFDPINLSLQELSAISLP